MPFSAIVGGLGDATSLATGISSLAGGGSGGSGQPNSTYGGNPGTYIPTDQAGADADYQGIFNQQYPLTTGVTGAVDPPLYQNLQEAYLNPYSATAQSGANAAGAYGTGVLAPGQENAATALYSAGNTVLGTGFDPQNALYNQTLQNVQGQSNVANAQSGVQGPAAAGITDNNLNNFNIDWQNQQLQRQTQGVQSAGQAYSGASGLGGSALTALTTSSQLPYTTYTGQLSDLNNAANTYSTGVGTSLAPEDSLANLLQSYLQLGQSANGLAQSGANSAFNQNQTVGSNIGSALNSLSNNSALANLFSGNSNPYNGNSQPDGAVSQSDLDNEMYYGQ